MNHHKPQSTLHVSSRAMSDTQRNGGYSQKELAGVALANNAGSLGANEPDSAPKSLAGQISMKDMGSRARVEEREAKAPSAEPTEQKHISTQSGALSLQRDLNLEDIAYKPTTESNAVAFEEFISEIRQYIPDESHSVILSAADTVLEVLKNGDLPVEAKKADIEELLSVKLSDQQLGEMVKASQKITDFHDQKKENTVTNGSQALAIEFEDENDQEAHLNVVVEPEGVQDVQDDFEIAETAPQDIVSVKLTTTQSPQTKVLALQDIKRDFLYSSVAALNPELEQEQIRDKCKQISKLMADKELSQNDLENKLLEVTEYKLLDLVKLCIDYRWKIVFQLQVLSGDKKKAFKEMEEMGLHLLLSEFGVTNEQPKKRRALDSGEPLKKTKPEIRKPKLVDLEGLVFEQGGNLMATSKVSLPKGSYQQNKKLYDIISVPALEGPAASDEDLVPISDLPEWAQAAFPAGETQRLNPIQSKIYPQAFKSDENLLLCAPTGAGKTNVAMLTFLRLLSNYRDEHTGRIALRSFKAVYVAPLKALVAEQTREFQRRLTSQFGVVVNEFTGDSSLSQKEIAETQILFTTPEKWDIVTRKLTESLYAQQVKLLIIDEIHLLHDDRGPVLESIIVRAKRTPDIRIVGLSATLPNYEDVARFIDVDPKKGLFYFDALYRPCPLEQQYIGIKEKKAIRKVAAMNEACYDKMKECIKNNHQLIIFVHSRKDTYKTAKWLSEKAAEDELLVTSSSVGAQEILKQEAENARNKNLSQILPSGFGIHHAGLQKEDRGTVEDLFAQGHISVLVSTATLAWGVNLPAHTVVIKGTDTYNPEKGSWVQLLPQDILQMLGRAGRPRYDKSGVGVIITAHDQLQYYMAVLNQQLPIESQLMSRLADNLNAESVLGQIKNLDNAVDYLGQTYLYIRMLKSPKLYQVGAEYENDKALYWKRADLAHTAFTILHKHKLITYDEDSGKVIPTELGKIAASFYIGHSTIFMYHNKLKPWMSEIDVLRVFASSEEFKYVPVRQEEKLEIAKLAEKCPIAIKEPPTEPLAKINVLLQAYIAHLLLEGFALMADMIYITQSAGRLLRAIHEICVKKLWASASLITLELCKIVEKRTWNTSSPFRQYGSLASPEIIKATEASHLPFISYLNLDAAELAEAFNLKGQSQNLYDLLQNFPKLEISCTAQPISRDTLRILADINANWVWNSILHGSKENFLIMVEDVNGELILFSDILQITPRNAQRTIALDIFVPISSPLPPNLFFTAVSEKWLNCLWRRPIEMFHTQLPKKPLSATELLDVQSVPTAALKDEKFIECFEFSHFNRFQSQAFHALWQTNDNIFLGIAKGGGKTVCAELAILNHWRQNKQRAIYLQPSQDLIDATLKTWEKKFANLTDPPKQIAKLTGELSADIKIQATSHLVLATPAQFDALTRRWRLRKAVTQIALVVADDVHLVSGGGSGGTAYETALSRVRLMSAHLKSELRIVALSHPLLYGRDLGEWLGCTKQNIFNFEAFERFKPMTEIKLEAYSGSPPVKQLLPKVNAFFNETKDSTIVFVSSKSAALEILPDIANFLKSDDVEAYVLKLSVAILRKFVQKGVGFFHLGMLGRDRIVMERLFTNGVLSVAIATKDCGICVPKTRNVVILGSQVHEISQPSDYYLNDILEMVGTCTEGRVLGLVHAPRVTYYSKFLNEGMPLESYLSFDLHDAFVHEIAARTFRSRQDCVDWLTYTFFYRRLVQNPSFYGLKSVGHVEVSEFLSDLVESTLKDLADSGLIELHDDDEDEDEDEDEEEEEEMLPLNGAMIASHYSVSFQTMQLFGKLTAKSRLRDILETVTSSTQFELLIYRPDDEHTLAQLASVVPFKVGSDVVLEASLTKAFLLVQAHLSRIKLPADLAEDLNIILKSILNLVYACVDSLSSEGYLNALQAMDLSQMLIQGMWNKESPLKQIPHVNSGMLERCKKYNVETIYDIMTLEDEERDDVLQLEGKELQDVADLVNKYPNIDVSYKLDLKDSVVAGEPKLITVTIERDEKMEDLDVVAPRFPGQKREGWWVVVGDADSRQLYGIKKTTVAHETQDIKMEFTVPVAGHHRLSVWCMCDSYLDVDKEMSFEIDVEEGEEDEY